jgi:hypothetical protein
MNDLIRVTEVLKPFIDSYVEEGSLAQELYFKRGIFVHEWCANYAKKIWKPIELDDYRGYVECFRYWFDKYVQEVIFIEQRFDDRAWGFTGQPDLACVLRGEITGTLIDYKTSAVTQKWWMGQLGAYYHLAQQFPFPIEKAGALQLFDDGRKAQFVVCDDPKEAFAAFLSALNAYRYFKR